MNSGELKTIKYVLFLLSIIQLIFGDYIAEKDLSL